MTANFIARQPPQHALVIAGETSLSDSLISAYLASRFVAPSLGIDFILGEERPLKALRLVDTVAIITAFNPFSTLLPLAQNQIANAALLNEMEGLGLACESINGMDPTGEWVEESFLVYGASKGQAICFGQKYGQNAIVWAEAPDLVPRLLLLR